MKKKLYFILISIIIYSSVIFGIIYKLKNNNVLEVEKGIYLSLLVDGEKTAKIPDKGNYFITVRCKEGNGKWLYDEWKFVVTDIEDEVKCYIDFKSNQPTLSNYVKGLVSTNQGNGKVIKENGYRYEGKQPNNYIWFNNELWRIIGTFDTTLADGTTIKSLTKIIRNYSVGTLSWNSSSTDNSWANSTLNKLLNSSYYYAENGTESDNCKVSLSKNGSCDYTYYGLREKYRNMVEQVKWNIGGINELYLIGSGGKTYTVDSAYTDEKLSTFSNYVGLLSASDYGYSVLAANCARTMKFGAYHSNNCGSYSWLYTGLYEWTINKNLYVSAENSVLAITSAGRISSQFSLNTTPSYNDPTVTLDFRPVVYLKENVKVVSGIGTYSNPYQIIM